MLFRQLVAYLAQQGKNEEEDEQSSSTKDKMAGPTNATTSGLLEPGTILNIYNRPVTAAPAGPHGVQQGTVRTGSVLANYPLMNAIPAKEYGDYKGATSTTYSKTFTTEDDPRFSKIAEKYGKDAAILLPTVVNGQFLTDDEAIARYAKTGEHLGIFDKWQSADPYAGAVHNSQQAIGDFYGKTSNQ